MCVYIQPRELFKFVFEAIISTTGEEAGTRRIYITMAYRVSLTGGAGLETSRMCTCVLPGRPWQDSNLDV